MPLPACLKSVGSNPVSVISRNERFAIGSLSKSLPEFDRLDKGPDHFRSQEIAVEAVQFVEPEVKARLIRIPPQKSEVLHQHKHAVDLCGPERRFLGDLTQDGCSRLSLVRQAINQRGLFLQSEEHAGI